MKLKQWLHFFKSDREDAEVASILAGSNTQLALASDEKRPARWGGRLLLLFLAAALAWAAFAPLSQGVPAHGFLKVEGNRKTIQHLKGGIVDEILVSEGDRVKAEQPLLKLNDTQLKAQQGIVESQLVIALATEARLSAERDNRALVSFPEFLLSRKDQPQARDAMQLQQQLFRTRRTALDGEQAIGRETISGLHQQITGLQAQEASKADQLASYNEELRLIRPLHEEGYVPRNRLFELERAVAYLAGQRSDDIANIGRAHSQIGELRLKILQSREVYQKEVETQLAEAQSKVADLSERLVATRDDLDRVVLRAPIDGVVVDLTMHTIGGVVAPGQKLMDLVPEGEGLVIEAQIPTHLIDNVRAGMDVDVHFTALDQTLVPTIPGKLVYVAADRMTDPRTDAPYYIGRVTINPEGLKLLGKQHLQPGMPADVVLKLNDHSMLGYLMKPLFNRLRFAFTER
jgi:membrane fusion protein, protease secretion system